jgi:hypothetical protein
MAELEKHSDRQASLRWATALLRRGVWADDVITVHGPHAPGAPYMWGECDGRIDGSPGRFGNVHVSFQTAQCRRFTDLRGLKVRDEDGDRFPILKASDLTPRARRWLSVAEKMVGGDSPPK